MLQKNERTMKLTLYFPAIFNNVYQNRSPCLTVAQLGSYLKSIGYQVQYVITDVKENYEKYSDKENLRLAYSYVHKDIADIEATKPDILLVSSWFFNLPYTIEITKLLKARNPHRIIILGGYPPSVIPEKVLGTAPHTDFLARGEGELVLKNLLYFLIKQHNKYTNKKKTIFKEIGKIEGISYIHKEKIIHTPDMAEFIDLDSLPFPDYEGIFALKEYPHLILKTTRGCSYNKCTFCTSEKYSKFRMNTVEYFEQEIKFFRKMFKKISHIDIVDNNFTFDLKRTQLMSRVLKKYRYTFSCFSRADIPKEIIDILADNNCTGIFFGLESMNKERLQKLGKTDNGEEYIRAAKQTISYAVRKFGKQHINIAALYSPSDINYNKKLETYLQRLNVHAHLSLIEPIPTYSIQMNTKFVKKRDIKRYFFATRYDYLAWLVPESYFCV